MPVMRKSLIFRFSVVLSLAAFLHLSVLAPLAPCLAAASEESCGLTQAEPEPSTMPHDHEAMAGDSRKDHAMHTTAGGHCEGGGSEEDDEGAIPQCSHHNPSPTDDTLSLYCNCHKHANEGKTVGMTLENRCMTCTSASVFLDAPGATGFAVAHVPTGIIPEPPDRPPVIS